MFNAFEARDGCLAPVPRDDLPERMDRAQWLDLLSPSEEERRLVESLYHETLPTAEEAQEIEASSRFYEDASGLHIHTFFLAEKSGRLRNTTVAFTLGRDRLLSLREQDIPVFRLLHQRIARRALAAADGAAVLITLFELQLDRLADRLQDLHAGLEDTSLQVLTRDSTGLDEAIESLANHEDENGKARLRLPAAPGRPLRTERDARARDAGRHRLVAAAQQVRVRAGELPHGRRPGLHQHPAEPDHQDLLRGGRDLSAADPGGQQLRHELRIHARAVVAPRLSDGDRAHDCRRRDPLLVLQAQGVAVMRARIFHVHEEGGLADVPRQAGQDRSGHFNRSTDPVV